MLSVTEKTVHMNMCLILNVYRGRAVWISRPTSIRFVCWVGWSAKFTKERWIHETNCSLAFWLLQPVYRNVKINSDEQPGLWSPYTKLPTPTPQFLKFRLRLLRFWNSDSDSFVKSQYVLIMVNLYGVSSPSRESSATFYSYNPFLSINRMVIVAVRVQCVEYLLVFKILNWGRTRSR
jgi:hypothetical protein